jgi:hypothetical protein
MRGTRRQILTAIALSTGESSMGRKQLREFAQDDGFLLLDDSVWLRFRPMQ